MLSLRAEIINAGCMEIVVLVGTPFVILLCLDKLLKEYKEYKKRKKIQEEE